MKTNRSPRMGQDMRAFFGCIATLERDGKRYSRQFADVNAVIAHCDDHEAVVISISTPDTILRDLDGTRADINEPESKTGGARRRLADRLLYPEAYHLGAKRRLDLWAGGR